MLQSMLPMQMKLTGECGRAVQQVRKAKTAQGGEVTVSSQDDEDAHGDDSGDDDVIAREGLMTAVCRPGRPSKAAGEATVVAGRGTRGRGRPPGHASITLKCRVLTVSSSTFIRVWTN